MIYLETNALRKLSSSLGDYYPSGYTSALALVEIVGGLSSNFQVRKKVVENLFRSNLEIDWRLPNDVLAESFGLLPSSLIQIRDLKVLCKLLINSETLEELEKACLGSGVQHGYGFFRNYKSVLSENFIRSTIEGNSKVKELYQATVKGDLAGKIFEFGIDGKGVLNSLQNENQEVNRSITVFSLANYFAQLVTTEKDKEAFAENLYKAYDGSTSYFIEAYSHYCIDKMWLYVD